MRAPVEGSFASLDAANGAFGFTLSPARSPLGCVLLFPKRTIGAKTGLPGSIWCGFRALRASRELDRPTGVRLPTTLRSLVHVRAFPRLGSGARMVVRLALAILLVSPFARA